MSRARDLSKLGNPNIIKADENSVGFGTQVAGNPANADSSLISAGIVTATAFYGDGSNLEGVASAGLGTAVDDTKDSIGQNIYFTNAELSINENTTVNAPDTSNIAYTQYQQVTVESGSELIIADGDSFIPDVLGIGTALQPSNITANGNGLFGTIYVDNIENAAGRGGPNFPLGITVAGVSTLGGNVSIGGTLTYEDVTNVDSIGIVTARNGIDITGGDLNAASNLILKTGGNERLRIDSAGHTLIGTSSWSFPKKFNIQSTTQDILSLSSGETTSGAVNTGVNIEFKVHNGSSLVGMGEMHVLKENGTSGNNASYMMFKTRASGGSTGEKLRIGSAGQLGIGGANYGSSGQVLTSGGASAAPQWADAGGGAWEVVSTTVMNGSASDFQFYGWSNSYAQYKIVFSDCYHASQTRMKLRFYTDATSGNNGTLNTSSLYKYTFTRIEADRNNSSSWGGSAQFGQNQQDYWYVASVNGTGMASPVWHGELIFPIKQSSYTAQHYSWGNLRCRDYAHFQISSQLADETSNFVTGCHVYFIANNDWTTARAPTNGRLTLLRMKYS